MRPAGVWCGAVHLDLNCPKCGHTLPVGLPDKPLPDGWQIHHAVPCGACGHVLRFQNGGSPTPAHHQRTTSKT